MNFEMDFEVITLGYENIVTGKREVDYHLNINLYELVPEGKNFLTSAVITREEMLDFLGLGT